MALPFVRHASERGHGTPGWVPVRQVELMTRTLCEAYRLVFVTPLSAENLSKTAHFNCCRGAAVEVLRFSSLGS